MIRLLICGSRTWTNRRLIRQKILEIGIENIEVLIEGEAPGADTIAKNEILKLGFPENRILEFPAQWRKFYKAAGMIRNKQMLVEGKPTLVLAFHDNLRNSRGTKNMIDLLHKAGVKYHVYSNPVKTF